MKMARSLFNLQALLLRFPRITHWSIVLILQYNMQHPSLLMNPYIHTWFYTYYTHMHTHADYYRVYQVFMSVIKLFLLFLVSELSCTYTTLTITKHTGDIILFVGDIQCNSRCADPANGWCGVLSDHPTGSGGHCCVSSHLSHCELCTDYPNSGAEQKVHIRWWSAKELI